MSGRAELVSRAQQYATQHALVLGDRLGHGVHGIVFVTESQSQSELRSAVKVHEREPDYCRERDVYLRLRENGVSAIHGCNVPRLLRYDDNLLVLEMTIVTRPFVLDFAGAFLDHAPDFSEEVMSDWLAEKYEQFGSRWPEVEIILAALKEYGIHMIDVNPGNIALGD